MLLLSNVLLNRNFRVVDFNRSTTTFVHVDNCGRIYKVAVPQNRGAGKTGWRSSFSCVVRIQRDEEDAKLFGVSDTWRVLGDVEDMGWMIDSMLKHFSGLDFDSLDAKLEWVREPYRKVTDFTQASPLCLVTTEGALMQTGH